MLKRIAVVLSTVFLAFLILSVSVFRSATPRSFCIVAATAKPAATGLSLNGESKTEIDYVFLFPGRVLPDSPFWFLKAFRDRFWLTLTANLTRKGELSLLFADKRLLYSEALFKKEKPALALSTLTKAEKYLEMASDFEQKHRNQGADTKSFLLTLAKASLKHREKIDEIAAISPEGIRPEVLKARAYSEKVYQTCKNALLSQGAAPPKNPFELP